MSIIQGELDDLNQVPYLRITQPLLDCLDFTSFENKEGRGSLYDRHRERVRSVFPCYPYTFTMIPFFALVTPDHELPPVRFPTNTIKLIPIPTLIFEAPLLLKIDPLSL
jgi:hypothetical protein